MSDTKNEIITKETQTPEIADSTAIIQVIERAALDPNVDIEKMERLLAMQERIMDRNAVQAFNSALQKAQSEMVPVVRDAENKQTSSKYAKLETISDKINPFIHGNGFSTSFGTDVSPIDAHYRITCMLSHVEGHSRNYFVDVPTDMVGLKGNANKTATHGFGSTMSYGRRYLKVLMFDISITDKDDDGNAASGTITEEQARDIESRLEAMGADKIAFCKHMKVGSIPTIPAAQYGKADNAIRAKEKKNANS